MGGTHTSLAPIPQSHAGLLWTVHVPDHQTIGHRHFPASSEQDRFYFTHKFHLQAGGFSSHKLVKAQNQ